MGETLPAKADDRKCSISYRDADAACGLLVGADIEHCPGTSRNGSPPRHSADCGDDVSKRVARSDGESVLSPLTDGIPGTKSLPLG